MADNLDTEPILSLLEKNTTPRCGSRIPAGSGLRRRHSGHSAPHWRWERDLFD
jgi:hypothetical protein